MPGLDDSDIYSVELAVDEACTNVIEHAYQGIEGGDIECTFDAGEEALTIIIRDHGQPFDPSSVPDANISPKLEKWRLCFLAVPSQMIASGECS